MNTINLRIPVDTINLLETATDFNSLKYYGVFHDLSLIIINGLKNSVCNLLALLDKVERLKPFSRLFNLAIQITEFCGQFFGFIDLAFIATKILCVKNWAASARVEINKIETGSLAQSECDILKEQEAKLLAEEFSAYYELRRLVFGSLIQIGSIIEFAATFTSTISATLLLPIRPITDIFTLAIAWINKKESDQIKKLQDRLITKIDRTIVDNDTTNSVDVFFKKAINSRIDLEDIFIEANSLKNKIILAYAVVAATIGVIVTLSLLAGAPLAPLGAVMIGTSSIGVLIAIALSLKQLALLTHYKRDFFWTLVTGTNTKLIIYRVIYNALKLIAKTDSGWVKTFKKEWLGKYKKLSEEAGWSDLTRYMMDTSKTNNVKSEKPSLSDLKQWLKKNKSPTTQFLDPAALNETSFYIDILLQHHYTFNKN